MKTQIIIRDGWEVIKEYDFLLTMNEGDAVEHKELEYKVRCSYLDIDKNVMQILIEIT